MRCSASSPRRGSRTCIEEGLHEFLTRFIHQNAALAQDVADGYLFGVQ